MQLFDGLKFVFLHPLNKGAFFRTLFRVCWWKINQLFFSFPAIVRLTDKIQCICYPHLSYSGLIIYTKWPDYAEWNFLLHYLKPNHVFVDVGAHSGDYSLIAADRITKGKIFAFEPEPRVLPYLYQNITINSLEKIIKVITLAISNKKGQSQFTLDQQSETSHLWKKSEIPTNKKITIMTTTLDEFVRQEKIKKIDVLKIDVEGAEGLVFRGGKNLFEKKKVDLILFELNPSNVDYGESAQDILRFLSQVGYQLMSFSKTDKFAKVQENSYRNIETQNLIAIHPKLLKHPLIMKYL